jgi:hypothetical protein
MLGNRDGAQARDIRARNDGPHPGPRLSRFVYCQSIYCNHSVTLNADWLPDDTPLLTLDPRMVCTKCGLIGADVRPDWTPHTSRRYFDGRWRDG